MMSNALKSIKPASKVFHVRGTAMSAMSCPATSSMTTNWGSFVPEERQTFVAAGMPISVTSSASPITAGVRWLGGMAYANALHNKTVAADAQVPGPGRSLPMPKKVAIRVAQRGAGGLTPALRPELSPISLPVFVIYQATTVEGWTFSDPYQNPRESVPE